MTVVRFYYMLRVLFNTNLSPVMDSDWTWLIQSGYVYYSGSTSLGLTQTGTEFVMDKFSKILAL